MTLNKENKFSVEVGDILRFSDDEQYIVTNILPGFYRNSLSFTIKDTRTKQTIYCYPSSKLYGAEIIKA